MVLLAGCLALAMALGLTPRMEALATARGWVSHPRADRHGRRSVALMGGVAIAAAVLTGSTVVWPGLEPRQMALLAASAMMFAVGLIDDRISLKPHTKLIGQMVAASLVVMAGIRLGFDITFQQPALEPLDVLLSIGFLVGITNAFNLLDNMDGLCAGIATIAAASLALQQSLAGEPGPAALCAAMAGGCLGFLRYNFSPARIYMGDGGSLFIGMFLAGAALSTPAIGPSRNLFSVLALPVLILMIPVLDTCLVTVCRKWFRRSVFAGGCDHTSHRLVAIGLSDSRAVLFLYALGLSGSLVALAIRWLDPPSGWLLLVAFLLAIGTIGIYLAQIRVYDDDDSLGDLLDRTAIPLLGQHRYRRRIAEVLLDTISIAIGLYLAFILRYEEALTAGDLGPLFRTALPVVVGCHLVAYFIVGVYRGIWRYTSLNDLPRFVGGALLGMVLTGVTLRLVEPTAGPAHVPLAINGLVQLALLSGSRISFRFLRDRLLAAVAAAGTRREVLLVGLHEEADLALRQIRLNGGWGLFPTGLITEDRDAVGLRIQGIAVLGTSASIHQVLAAGNYSEVLLVDPSYPPDKWYAIQSACAEAGIPTGICQTLLRPLDPVPPSLDPATVPAD